VLKGLIQSRYVPAAVAALLIAVFIALASSIALEKSNTWDEPAHILSGYAYLNEGNETLSSAFHPILGRSIVALFPSLLLDLDYNAEVRPEGEKGSNFLGYSLKFIYENRADGEKVLFLARLGNILVGALLGVYVFIWSKRLWGVKGALLSLLVYVLSPNILAHSSLATTDITVTAFFFIAAYYLYRLISEGPTPARAAGAGIAIALAMTSKHTSVMLLPVVGVCFVMGLRRERPLKVLSCYALLAVTVLFVIWAVYGFRFHTEGPNYHPPDWQLISGSPLHPFFGLLRRLRLLPELYLYGLESIMVGAGSGRAAFLFGMYSTTGWWYYFIAAFFIKTPVPTLVLIAAALVYLTRDGQGRRKAVFPLALAAMIFVAVSSQNVNIGLRHVLPAYPFLFIVIGYVSCIRTESKRIARVSLCAVLLFYLYTAISIHPDQLAYFNEIVGGPDNGYRYLADSNIDWGQDLKGLKRYMDEHGIERIYLAYFGFSDPGYFGIKYDYLPSYAIMNPVTSKKEVRLEGWFAISATMLEGVYLADRDLYGLFRRLRPVGNVGHSILIYRLEGR